MCLLRHLGCAIDPLMAYQCFAAINSHSPPTIHGKFSTSRSLFSEPSLTQALLVTSSCLAKHIFFLCVLSCTIQQRSLFKISPCCIFLLGSRSLYCSKIRLFLPNDGKNLCDHWWVFLKPLHPAWKSFKWP